MKIIKSEGRTEVWLTGSEVRRLERGGSITKDGFEVYMDFYAGDEYRTNQVNPEKVKNA